MTQQNTPADDEEYETDYYDARGNVCGGGIYDAGGHIVPERYMDYLGDVDSRRDELKYGE